MGSMSVSHWLIVLVIIVLLFGAKKIPELAKGLGKGIKTFKKEMENDEDEVVEKVEKKETKAKDAIDATVEETKKA
ncbi:twin-arginine translocase TatA/TatE family subunit [Campylobacter geochelonis]|uniref:Sec-independent protein translocase protein TatA n=1 Tax=Campylobacter geochelonis TaxID=1780362 RepID=A0A128ENI7_9BACT|nr:twin-arginine translocase TatA/TatE family subunit [Campylobacter geochelonis]QKF70803.1 twin arginine translocation system, TatA/E family protein [Campylobacter geochelonis]CZE47373.1 twin arginine-targeting protein translocase [Campylobacter geochelonis]CZE48101.1 twin arginine-targeting protein translocase [Campylobacter geochelonis]CZE50572.1 twin arginine-targeting protein translocase [Campylobacter geochelonis]